MNWMEQQAGAAAGGRELVIGLVNNTSDRALKGTERDFRDVLRAAATRPSGEPATLRFRLFTCPEIRRASRPQGAHGEPYDDIGELFASRLDALIVTGMEPQAATLRDEPVFASLARVADWAQAQAIPVIWSCLAAHAAVLHADGIEREKLPQKLSGVFACDVVAAGHVLAAGLPPRVACPHSRHHDLPEAALAARGYEILSRSEAAGADIFIKHRPAPWVFFQGHPEYDADALRLEYRRDIRRYLLGDVSAYPAPPLNYFDPGMEAALGHFRQQTLRGRHDLAGLEELFRRAAPAASPAPWHPTTLNFLANWLATIAPAASTPGAGR